MNTFSTARLSATKLAPDDLDDLVQLHLDPEVTRFLGGVRSADNTARYLDTNLQHWTDHGFGLWALRTADGAFMGRAGLRYLDLDDDQDLELAYSFVRSAWGQGLATEIAEALVDIWKMRVDHPTLVGVVMKGHSASERVLFKAGFCYDRDVRLRDADFGVFRQAK